ncbi:hypothetical protein CLIB1444_03S08768 [[Candida] jaroonii]|uniref:Uncharacterized protein n=1 Tax=[Candida] jaroonii TaxID=467808 RepID=A0ACA9Y5K1_9ASCO|nr:hypothetical protein CLIB1444_03S08768 [[Candida] jaroonii]
MKYWHDKLFYIEEESFKQSVDAQKLNIKKLPELNNNVYDDFKLDTSSKQEVIENLGLNKSVVISNGSDKSALGFNESFDDFERSVKILNCGGCVVSLKWLPGNKEFAYLAASVITGENLLGSKELSIFYHDGGNSIPSCLQIWKVSNTDCSFELLKILDTSILGACVDLSWVPGEFKEVGVLSGVFKDGKVHFFKIDDTQQFGKIKESSLSYGISGDGIACFDYLSNDRIIVGTKNGFIAEFILPNYQTSNDDNLSMPSFMYNINDGPLSYITIANPAQGKFIISVNTHGPSSFTLDYDDIIGKMIENLTSLVRPKLNSYLDVLICSDPLDVASFSILRHTNERPTQILKVNGVVTSLASSTTLNHPLVLISSSYGELFVVNISRRILIASKSTSKALVPLRLWKIAYISKNEFYFNPNFEVEKVDKPTDVSPSPNEVNIGCLDWNENLNGSSIYAAGTHGGLIILEKLDC